MICVANGTLWGLSHTNISCFTEYSQEHLSCVVLKYAFKASYQPKARTGYLIHLSLPNLCRKYLISLNSDNSQHDKVTVPYNAVKEIMFVRRKKSLNQLIWNFLSIKIFKIVTMKWKYFVSVWNIWYIVSFCLWIHVFIFITKQISLSTHFFSYRFSKHKTGVSVHMIQNTTLKQLLYTLRVLYHTKYFIYNISCLIH